MQMHSKNIVIAVSLGAVPALAYASDFTRIFVALGAVVIGFVLIILSLFTLASKSRERTVILLTVTLILTAIGLGMISDEAKHMGDSDKYISYAVVLAPSFLSIIAAIFSLRKNPIKSKSSND